MVQGNKWTCPEGRIGVAASVDEVALGDLFCSDTRGPSGATSRHAVVDMLTIDHSLDLSPPAKSNQAIPWPLLSLFALLSGCPDDGFCQLARQAHRLRHLT